MQTVPSLEDSVCASSSQVFLNLRSAQCLDDRIDLSVMVAQTGLGVAVWGRQASNVAVLLLGLEGWRSLDRRVRVARCDDGECRQHCCCAWPGPIAVAVAVPCVALPTLSA
jgi:hypothetical protein